MSFARSSEIEVNDVFMWRLRNNTMQGLMQNNTWKDILIITHNTQWSDAIHNFLVQDWLISRAFLRVKLNLPSRHSQWRQHILAANKWYAHVLTFQCRLLRSIWGGRWRQRRSDARRCVVAPSRDRTRSCIPRTPVAIPRAVCTHSRRECSELPWRSRTIRPRAHAQYVPLDSNKSAAGATCILPPVCSVHAYVWFCYWLDLTYDSISEFALDNIFS